MSHASVIGRLHVPPILNTIYLVHVPGMPLFHTHALCSRLLRIYIFMNFMILSKTAKLH